MARKKQRRVKARDTSPVIEALEPRILLSADFPGLDAALPSADDLSEVDADQILTTAETFFEQQSADNDSQPTGGSEQDLQVPNADPLDSQSARHELIIIDPNVPNHQQLLSDVYTHASDDTFLEVVLLEPDESGVEQITRALFRYADLDAIHLISHGTDGELVLGNALLDAEALVDKEDFIASWGSALNQDGDILIYGCNLAATEAGEAFVDTLAALSGADVAASDDRTGYASLGGDWELEHQAGAIESDVVGSDLAQPTWQHVLDGTLWLSTDSNVSGPNAADGLPAGWTEGHVLSFGGPDLAHGAATDGDLSLVIDFNSFTTGADPVDAGALHYVSRDLTIGGSANTFDLKAGDVLVSFLQDLTIAAPYSSTGLDLPVADQDLLVFRPATFDNFSTGTFTILLDDVVTDDLKGVSLIQQDTTIGGTDVAAGSFLIIAEASGTTSIDLFEPTGVGVGTTTGSVSPLIDLSSLGIDAHRLRGIEVIEAATTIGGQALSKGALLATLNVDDNVTGVGSNDLLVDKNDVFVLNLTATVGTTTGTTSMFLDGSLVGLDDSPTAENPYALALYNHSQLTVDTTSDVSDGDTSSIDNLLLSKGADGKISLREAIAASNASPNGDVADAIRFNISTADSGYIDPTPTVGDEYWKITVNGAGGPNTNGPGGPTGNGFDFIIDPVVIDATTQSGYSGTPLIELDGTTLGAATNINGLTLRTNDSAIEGFSVVGFPDEGLEIDGSTGFGDNNVIEMNWVGFDGTSSPSANAQDGILISVDADNNEIRNNVVGASGQEGIHIRTNSDGNWVWGNIVGLGPDGLTDVGNTGNGIYIEGASTGNIIGSNGDGTNDAAEANTISGNTAAGVYITGAGTDGNTIAGNLIGTDAAGTLDRGNDLSGVYITNGAGNTTIGGLNPGERNVIAGNGADNIKIEATAGTGNTIIGNYIGVDALGTSKLNNGGSGVDIQADGNTIGGTTVSARNVISGSLYNGVVVSGDNNLIQGNYIGTDVTGTLDLGNNRNGVWISGGSNNLVGGTESLAGNLIHGNVRNGVLVSNGTPTGNTILGNTIHGNDWIGIDLSKTIDGDNVTGNDADDADSGQPNELQNYPDITQAELSGTDLTLSGTLETDGLSAQYRVEFFGMASGSEDLSNGEGRYYLGSTTVTTNGSGDATFSNVTLAAVPVGSGDWVTATATRIVDPVGINDLAIYGDTSEFAQNVLINSDPVFIPNGVGYWQFDEGVGTPTTGDSAYGSTTGKLGAFVGPDGSDPVWTTGQFGSALQFDGVDDYVEIEDAPELDITGAQFSASLWVKPDRLPGTEDMFLMKGDRTGNSNVNYYLSWKSSGHMTWAFKSDGYFEYLDMNVPLPTVGVWNHVAIVFNQPDVSLYVNGTEYTYSDVATGGTDLDKPLVANNEPLWIGAGRKGGNIVLPGQYSAPFSGTIDELAIYDRALTSAEVETIRTNQPAAAAATNFVVAEHSSNGTVLGTVAASDPDGDSILYSISAGNTDGAFTIDGNGQITVSNSAALDYDTNPSFVLTVTADDGNDGITNQVVNVAVNAPTTIGGDDTAGLTEDAGAVGGYLSVSGTLTAIDVDGPDDNFTPASHRGTLGELVIDGSGDWTYSVDNSLPAIQGLAAGSSVDDVISVSSIDGTTHDITITITANAAPAAMDDISYTVGEDGSLAAGWWDADWSRRSTITFDNSGQGELTDIPVLVILNSGNIDYGLTQNNGGDLRFFDAGGTPLAYDIEEWNELGDSYVWIKVPRIVGGSNTDTITMYWGNGSAASGENASAVWSNSYLSVHHLHNDFTDATEQRNTAKNRGTADIGGQVGDGQHFDGTDDSINLGSDASLQDIFDGGGTVSAWIYVDGWGENGYGRIFDKSGGTTPSTSTPGWALQLFGSQQGLLFQVAFDGGLGQWGTQAGSINLNAWNYVSLTYDSSSASNAPEIYVNGQLQTLNPAYTTVPTGTAVSDAAYDLTVGNHAAAPSRTFDGTIDNVQISSTARSADWIKTQYLATTGVFASVANLVDAEVIGASISGVLDNDTVVDPHTPRATNLNTTGTLGLVTLNDDGTFTYDTNGQFDQLAAGATATDTFTYELDDGVNLPTVATVTMTVNGANDDPVLTFGEGNKVYTENAARVIIDSTMTVSDAELADLDGGTLTVSVSANGATEDRLAVVQQGTGDGQVGQTGSDITYNFGAGAVVIGTVSGGTNGSDPLVITFNTNSTIAAAEAVARRVAYMAIGEDPSTATRTVQFVVTDGDGGTSTAITKDITVNAINEAPVARPDGVHLTFDGDDYVRVADDPSLQVMNTVTIEAWINQDPSVRDTGAGSQLIVNKEGEYELGITADTGEIKFAIARSDNTWTWHNTGYFVSAGEWTHVAVTFDGVASEARTYINGQLVDTLSQPGPIGEVYASYDSLTIGGRENDTSQRFNGQIDEVRVWTTARTQGQIQANLNGLLGGAEPGLGGYWRLNEAAGGTITDQSGNGNDGLLAGSPNTPTYQGYITDQNTVLNIVAGAGVLANDTDIDSGSLTVTNLDTSGILGSLILNTVDGSFSYDPNGAFDALDVGEQATDTFTYTASDGLADSDPVTVTITVTGVNDTPTTSGLSNVIVNEDAPNTVIDLHAAFADLEDPNNAFVYTIDGNTNAALFASTAIAGGNLTLDYAADANGTTDMTVRATDTGGLWVESTFTATVTAVNDEPSLALGGDQSVGYASGAHTVTSFASALPGGGADESGRTFTYNVSNDNNALFSVQPTIDAAGTLSYTVANGQDGTATVTVSVTDSGGTANGGDDTSSDQTFTITVGTNTAPTVTSIGDQAIAEDGATVALTFTVDDIETAVASLVVTATSDNPALIPDGNLGLVDDGNGNWTIQATPLANQHGTATITVTVDDGTTTTNETFDITVTPLDDLGTITGDTSFSGNEGDTATGDLDATDVDGLADGTYFSISSQGANGTASIDALTGAWNYTPSDPDWFGSDSFEAMVTDDLGGMTTQLVGINLSNVDDPSVITGAASGTVQIAGALTVSGVLSITDVDPADNPSFPDLMATAGDAGYGTFGMSSGTWTYVLDDTHLAVQALSPGDSLVDSHTFVATDGATQLVTVTISSPPIPIEMGDPPSRELDPVPDFLTDEPPEETGGSDARDEAASDGSDEPPTEGESSSDPVVDAGLVDLPGVTPTFESSEVLLSVLAERGSDTRPTTQQTDFQVEKPDVAAARTFLQELKSFWVEPAEVSGPEISEVRLSQAFWDGLDKLEQDMDDAGRREEARTQLSAEAAAGVSISLTAGFVSWALRAGSMAASFLAAMPTWRNFDPMPVLSADEKNRRAEFDEEDAQAEQDEATEKLFER